MKTQSPLPRHFATLLLCAALGCAKIDQFKDKMRQMRNKESDAYANLYAKADHWEKILREKYAEAKRRKALEIPDEVSKWINLKNSKTFSLWGYCIVEGSTVTLSGGAESQVVCKDGKFEFKLDMSMAPDGKVDFLLGVNYENYKFDLPYSVTKDTVEPLVAILSPDPGKVFSLEFLKEPLLVSGTCSKEQSRIRLLIDQAPYGLAEGIPCADGKWAMQIDLLATKNGVVDFVAQVTDLVENVNVSESISVTNLIEAPTVALGPPSPSMIGGGNAEASASIGVSIDGAEKSSLTAEHVQILPTGANCASKEVLATQDPTKYTIKVKKCTGEGSIKIKVEGGVSENLVGLPNAPVTSQDSLMVDQLGPKLVIVEPTVHEFDFSKDPNLTVGYRINLSDKNPSTFDIKESNLEFKNTGDVSCYASFSPAAGKQQYFVLHSCIGNGTVSFRIKPGSAADRLGNVSLVSDFSLPIKIINVTGRIVISSPIPTIISNLSLNGNSKFSQTVTYQKAKDIILSKAFITQEIIQGNPSCRDVTITGAAPEMSRVVTLSNCIGDGIARIRIAKGSAKDLNGLPMPSYVLNPGFPTRTLPNPSYRVDSTRPKIVSVSRYGAVGGVAFSFPQYFTVSFSEPIAVNTLAPADIIQKGTGVIDGLEWKISKVGDGSSIILRATGTMKTEGSFGFTINAGTFEDLSGNTNINGVNSMLLQLVSPLPQGWGQYGMLSGSGVSFTGFGNGQDTHISNQLETLNSVRVNTSRSLDTATNEWIPMQSSEPLGYINGTPISSQMVTFRGILHGIFQSRVENDHLISLFKQTNKYNWNDRRALNVKPDPTLVAGLAPGELLLINPMSVTTEEYPATSYDRQRIYANWFESERHTSGYFRVAMYNGTAWSRILNIPTLASTPGIAGAAVKGHYFLYKKYTHLKSMQGLSKFNPETSTWSDVVIPPTVAPTLGASPSLAAYKNLLFIGTSITDPVTKLVRQRITVYNPVTQAWSALDTGAHGLNHQIDFNEGRGTLSVVYGATQTNLLLTFDEYPRTDPTQTKRRYLVLNQAGTGWTEINGIEENFMAKKGILSRANLKFVVSNRYLHAIWSTVSGKWLIARTKVGF